MAKYKFEQFSAAISNPTIEVVGVRDNMDSTCSVEVKLISAQTELGVNLTGFTYTDTWSDSDISAWVAKDLKRYEV